MLKMKLPQRKSAHSASDEEEDEEEERAAGVGMCSLACPASGVPSSLQRETVYQWFVQALGPAQRLEFACGLLDLCNPLELRFLGACLEDLARKDCHYLRECESRANALGAEPEAALQQLLGDVTERTARSRLIVYLALLGSENREVAGRLYRLLLLPPGTEGWGDKEELAACREEMLLLFTMASLHPAFSFHQRVTLRERLDRLREAICPKSHSEEGNIPEYFPSHEKPGMDGSTGASNGLIGTSRGLQQEAVHIENINFKHVHRRRVDKNPEYTFEVSWSDNSKTSVTKCYRELVEFLLTLPKELSNEHIDKTILDALLLGKRRGEHQYSDLELLIQKIFSSPSHALLQNQRVYRFFSNVRIDSLYSSDMPGGSKCIKASEDSSETSSQEEDFLHHMAGQKKPGKSSVLNFVGLKSVSSEAIHISQNVAEWRKKNITDIQHCLSEGHQLNPQPRMLDKRSSHEASRENVERNFSRSTCKANGVKSQSSWVFSVKEPATEVGSGHETCGETSSESYSSPPSPHQNRRGSFESEEERDRDTDSNSEESSKHAPIFPTFGVVNSLPANLSDHPRNNEERTCNDSLNSSSFPHISMLPTVHCVVPDIETLEAGIQSPLPTEGKILGMLVGPVSVTPVRDVFHEGSLGIVPPSVASAVDEPEKSIALRTPPMAIAPSTFLPRNCSPSNPALHAPVQRLKLPTQGLSETCAVNGSTQASLGLNSASAGFFSIHNQGKFVCPPATVSDPLSKPQVVSLNQVVPHLDGNAGVVSPATNVKLVLSGTNLSPAPTTVPYPLSGPSLPSGVLPTQHNGVLNTSVPVASLPTNGIGQVQTAVPLTVPTHSPGPAPSPSPALTHSTAQSDSTSFISATVGNASTNGTLLQPQQMGPGACGSCGRRCSCVVPMGSYYYASPITGQMYTRVPFPFPIPSICNSTYLNQAHQSNGTPYPVFVHQPSYTNGLMHDPVLGGQTSYSMQQVAGFPRLYPMYPATNVVGNANGSVAKKNGNVSCYNCGVTGHYAQDCKQPPMEPSQQGNRDSSQRTCF